MSETTEPTTEEVVTQEATTDEPRLTQSEVDRLIKDRLAREKAKYADYDQLKEAAAKLTELEDAQKSELQRAQEQATATAAELQAMKDRLRETTVRSAIANAATKHGAVNADQVRRLIDLDIEVDEDGNVTTDVDAVVSQFLADNPHLVVATGARPTTVPPVAGLGQGSGSTPTLRLEDLENIDPKELAMNPELREAYIRLRDSSY